MNVRTLTGLLSIFLMGATYVAAAPPVVRSLSTRGLTTGATTTLTITGVGLLPDPRVVLSVPITAQTVRPGATARQVEIDVTLANDTPAGVYQLWLATAGGISTASAVAIDHLPSLPFAPEVATLPVGLTGAAPGGTILRTTFTGRARQPVVVEVEARRLGSSLSPVLHLYNDRGVQVAWARGSGSLSGDARMALPLPADGRYTVELHDALYRGAGASYFRLKIGHTEYADLAFPLGVKLGSSVPIGFVASNFPSGSAVVATGTIAGEAPVPWPPLASISGTRPRVVVSEIDEVLEVPSSGPPQSLVPPMAVSGRLELDSEQDRYRIAVKPGSKLRFDCLANRLGSPVDGVLTVAAEKGGVLATSDDRPGTADPGLDFTVPAGVEAIVVSLRDLNNRGGSDFIYRLAVTPVGSPDFSLAVIGDVVQLPAEGQAIVRVRATRSSYSGPIKLSLAGLPSDVRVEGLEIPERATDTLLSLAVGKTSPAALVTSIVGESVHPTIKLRRMVTLDESASTKTQPWLRRELALGISQPAVLSIAWTPVSAEANLPLGGSLAANVTVTRAAGTAGPVRLSLLTSQIMPQKKEEQKPDRPRQPAQVKLVDDVERSVRLKQPVTIAADKPTAPIEVLVPGDLPAVPYDLAVQAELLSADGKSVVATVVSPVRRLLPKFPFTVQLTGADKVEAKAGTGETGKLVGTLTRLPGFGAPVTITLLGLPEELPAPRVVVPAGQSDFTLPVAFPFNAPKGDLKGLSLVGTSQAGPNLSVRSNEIAVAVRVTPGGPPPALLRLFEDEDEFVAYLNEGAGKATLETGDAYSGSAALRVTPDARGRKRVPGWGLRIAEKPGDGEYRYLRFAWKMNGGNNVLLQLVTDVGRAKQDRLLGPPFAYEAGDGGNTLRVPALRLDEKLPANWVVVTRDLYADFGACTLEGVNLVPGKGTFAGLDSVYLGKTPQDFAACPPPRPAAKK